MNKIDSEKNKFGLSKPQFYFFVSISIFWLVCCFFLLTSPMPIRIIVKYFPYLTYHFSIGIAGIIIYFFFFVIFFYNNYISKAMTYKKTIVFMIAVSAFYVFIILFRANWVFSDDHEFIRTTAINKYISPYFGGGRFAILGHIHYNLPLFILKCLGINTGLPVEVHFAFIAVFFIVSFLSLYALFNKWSFNNKYSAFALFFVSTFFFLGSDFSYVFFQLIFPETPVIMLFSFFMLMYYNAIETDKVKYYIFAFFAAVYSSYCKEPVFGVFLVISFANHLFRYKEESKRERIFYLGLIANGILFIILYYFLSFKNATGFYNEGRVAIGEFRLLLSIFTENPILIIMFFFGFIRLYFIITKKERGHLYYDSLLFAGIAYTFAYFVLRLNNGYYFLPSIILFLPSLVYWIQYLFKKKYAHALWLFFLLILIYTYNFVPIVQNIKNTWQDRSEFMPYIADLFSKYNDGNEFIWYESDNRITDNTFYIQVREWRKWTENAFLNYLNKSEGKEFFIVKKSLEYTDMKQDTLFFYPIDNDQYQPMPESLVNILQNNDFKLYKDSYGVLIFKR